jgi:hypothetical protein
MARLSRPLRRLPSEGGASGRVVVPYQPVLETKTGPRHVHRSLQGLLSHVPGKHAEASATCVAVERQVIQDCLGTMPWEHRPWVTVFVGPVAARLGEPEGLMACAPRSVPTRGTPAVGVKRPWCGHRGQVDNGQVGGFMGDVSRHEPAWLDFRVSLSEEWPRDAPRRQAGHVPPEGRSHTRHEPCWERRDAWGGQGPHGGVTGDDARGRHRRFRHALRERGER